MKLRIPTNSLDNPDEDSLNIGTEHIDVEIVIDPEYSMRGEHIPGYGGDTIYLREWNEQVLLHEIMHVALRNIPELRTKEDPYSHNIISRIEVALWETGWRMTENKSL